MITFTSTTIDSSFFLLLSSLKTLLPSHFSNPSLIFSLQTFLPSSSLIFPMYPSFIFFKTSLPLPSSFYLFLPSFLSFTYLKFHRVPFLSIPVNLFLDFKLFLPFVVFFFSSSCSYIKVCPPLPRLISPH